MAALRTVTLNTGYDDYYTVGDIVWGGVSTNKDYRSVCSGKGISCARAAVALGLETVAYALVGARDVADYSSRLDAESIPHRLVDVPGSTRHNLTLVDATGAKVAAHFVGKGYELADRTPLEELTALVLADIKPGDVVTLNGSTPAGLPDDTWAGLAEAAKARGAVVVVDAQRGALAAALEVPGVLAFKPNDDEILALPGIKDSADPVGAALAAFEHAGAQLPLVSLGADGVAFLDGGRRVRGACRVERPIQSVMAGDTFVAGLAWGYLQGGDKESWVRHALAAAAAHVAGAQGEALRELAAQNLPRVTFTTA